MFTSYSLECLLPSTGQRCIQVCSDFDSFDRWRLLICMFCSSLSRFKFSLMWRRHHCWWRAGNLDLLPAIMAIEQWGFFSVVFLPRLWHGTSVFKVISEVLWHSYMRLEVELSLPVLMTYVFRVGNLNHWPSACDANVFARGCHRGGNNTACRDARSIYRYIFTDY